MIQTVTVTSVSEFTQNIEALISSTSPSFWYRGARKAKSFTLKPTLYRRADIDSFVKFAEIERSLITTFRHRSPPFVQELPIDDLELLFLMQHHGIPTRLLDWSENPFVALFFAVLEGDHSVNDEDSVVWVLDPVQLNLKSLAHVSHRGGIIQISDTTAKGFRPSTEEMKTDPVAMYGVHNSRRIVAQRGVFTVFGQGQQALEETKIVLDNDSVLRRIIIPKNNRVEVATRLFSMGITDSTLFPDLDGLAREIKRQNGY